MKKSLFASALAACMLLGTALVPVGAATLPAQEGAVTREGYHADFEGELAAVDWLDASRSSGLQLTTDSPLGGTQSLLMNGARLGTVDFSPAFTDELVCVSFDVQARNVPTGELPAVANEFNANELFQLRFSEGRSYIPSDNFYSTDFRIYRDPTETDKLYFTGFEGDPSALMDTAIAVDSFGSFDPVYKFPLADTYHVKLLYSPYRIYIDINNGAIRTVSASSRGKVGDFRIFTREGVDIVLDNLKIYGAANNPYRPAAGLQKALQAGLFTGYLDADYSLDGVILSRMNDAQRLAWTNVSAATSKDMTHYTGVMLDMLTDSRTLEIDYKVIDSGFGRTWPTVFDVYLNGENQFVNGNPQADQGAPGIRTTKQGTYTFRYELPAGAPEANRITVAFPDNVALALRDVRMDADSRAVAVDKDKKLLVLGDSISAGAECFDPYSTYFQQVAMTYGLDMLNQAVSGTSFKPDCIIPGEYGGFTPDYVIMAYGTNTFAGGYGDKTTTLASLETDVPGCIAAIEEKFPEAKIIALTPILRSDENGPNFTLQDVISKIKEIYARYPEISVIDCHEFVPNEAEYFSQPTFFLHPNTLGHVEYGKNLIAAIDAANLIPRPETVDWPAEAKAKLDAMGIAFRYGVQLYRDAAQAGNEIPLLVRGNNVVKVDTTSAASTAALFNDYVIFAGLYQNNVLHSAKLLTKADIAAGTDTLSFVLPDDADPSQYVLRLFAWDGVQTLVPLGSVKEILGSQPPYTRVLFEDNMEGKTPGKPADDAAATSLMNQGVTFTGAASYFVGGNGIQIVTGEDAIDGQSLLFTQGSVATGTDPTNYLANLGIEDRYAVFEMDVRPMTLGEGTHYLVQLYHKPQDATQADAEIKLDFSGGYVNSNIAGTTGRPYTLGETGHLKLIIDRGNGTQNALLTVYWNGQLVNDQSDLGRPASQIRYFFTQFWDGTASPSGKIVLDNLKLTAANYLPEE